MTTKRPFHHGDLSAALVEVALEAIERLGHEAVSLRELAAAAGVSRAAPYRHFADRRALLSAVAGRGFAALDAAVMAGSASGCTPRARLRCGARAFLRFAADRPHLFALLFATDLLTGPEPPSPELREPATLSYARMERGVAAAYPALDDAGVKARALTMSSTLQGFARMRRDRRIKPFMLGPLTEAELEEAVLTAATGVGPDEI